MISICARAFSRNTATNANFQVQLLNIVRHSVRAAPSPLPLADSLLYPGAVLLVERCPCVLWQVCKLLEAPVVQQIERGACAAVGL